MNWKIPVITLAGFALIIAALVFGGVQPFEGLRVLIDGAFGSPAGLRETLKRTTPMLFLGAAVFIALKAGLFNIGADGQFIIGALVGTAVILKVPGPIGIVLAIIAGAIGGALWAFPAGWIRAYRGGHEVITTIMLNNIAGFLSVYLLTTFLQSPDSQAPTTDRLPENSWLPNLIEGGPFRLNLSVLLGLAAVIVLAFWLNKTVSGFELKATGGNPGAARTAGVEVKKVMVKAMLTSGLLSGIAGVLQVLAHDKRFYEGISPGYGFDALGVALLAGGTPWGLIPSAILFGSLAQGTTALSIEGVPQGLNGILLAVLIIVFAAFRYRKEKQSSD